jgi:hypothetical protein
MTAPIRSMPEVDVPDPARVIAVIRCHDDLVEAFRTIKDMLQLSNQVCDDLIDLTDGFTDKVLGPTRAKGLSPFMFDNFTSFFAVQFEMKVDIEAARLVQDRWEKREDRRIHVNASRLSKSVMKRAKPEVCRDLLKLARKQRNLKLSPKQRSMIARKAARARWRKERNGVVRC